MISDGEGVPGLEDTLAVTQQHVNAVAGLVGDNQVEVAVAVDVSHRHPDRSSPCGEAAQTIGRASEGHVLSMGRPRLALNWRTRWPGGPPPGALPPGAGFPHQPAQVTECSLGTGRFLVGAHADAAGSPCPLPNPGIRSRRRPWVAEREWQRPLGVLPTRDS